MDLLYGVANTLIYLHIFAKMLAPFALGVAGFAAVTQENTRRFWLTICWLSTILFAVVFGGYNLIIQPQIPQADPFPISDLFISFLFVCLGLSCWFCWLRSGHPWLNATTQKLTKRSAAERNKKTDVREIEKFLPEASKPYDPQKYFDPVKGIFVGLDETKKPVFIKKSVFNECHLLLSGRSRIGKGVAAQIILSQAIQQNDSVVILDPKMDSWMPSTFFGVCKNASKNYHFINLNQSFGHQINPLQGATEEELENVIISGYGIDEKGDIADHYRLEDRAAARQFAEYVAKNKGSTFASGFNALGENWIEKAKNFHSYMREMGSLKSVNAKVGLNLEDFVKNGGCLYVVGDMSNSRILRAQRMILLRLMFIAKNREFNADSRTITVFADEFKCHISKPFTTTLGAAAGWGMHCLLAFQSFADLEDMPKDLDKNAVKGAVIENTSISISYGIKDPVTADYISDMTGEILVDDEVRRVQKNAALAEVVNNERQIRQATRNLFDRNMVMNMRKETAIFCVAGELTKAIHISKLHVNKTPEAIQINEVEGDKIIAAQELI